MCLRWYCHGVAALPVRPACHRLGHLFKPRRRPASEKKEKRTSLPGAAVVVRGNGEPMRCKDMVAKVVDKGLWRTDAPTPEATLYSAILREMKKGKTAIRENGAGAVRLERLGRSTNPSFTEPGRSGWGA